MPHVQALTTACAADASRPSQCGAGTTGVVTEGGQMGRFENTDPGERRRAAMEADPAPKVFRAAAAPYVLPMRSRIPRPTAFSPLQ